MKKECQPGTPTAKSVCPTVEQKSSGTQARSKLRPGIDRRTYHQTNRPSYRDIRTLLSKKERKREKNVKTKKRQ